MNCHDYLYARSQPRVNSRRWFLKECGLGLGKIALGSLLTNAFISNSRAATASATASKLRTPHFPGKAKRVIHLFMAGAPSQLDLFDYKPELTRLAGKPLPPSVIGGQRYAFIRPDAAVLGPQFKFARHGQSGAELSEMLPHIAEIVDDICLIKSMKTDQFNHAPGQIFLNTGFSQPGRPSLGTWVIYGLGSESQNLPAFVVMSTGSGISGGSANWSSGFMPSVYAGVRFRNQGDPILDVSSPNGVDAKLQRDSLDLIEELNHARLGLVGDPEIETRIASYEMAYRLQTSAPELMDLKKESKETLEMSVSPQFEKELRRNRPGLSGARERPQATRTVGRDARHLGRGIWPHADGRDERRAGPQSRPRSSSAGVHRLARRRWHQTGCQLRCDGRSGISRGQR